MPAIRAASGLREHEAMKQVLVVDDSATMRRMVMASLRVLKEISFHEAANGLEAIERLALTPVDLMVLDLNMPDMHGLAVVTFVRGHERYREIPILVLTTRGDDESRAAALGSGATVYLTKPFTPDALAGHIRQLLKL